MARRCRGFGAWLPLLVLGAAVPALGAPSANVDIGMGGTPTITGAINGSVIAASNSLLSDLSVTVDFGEVSPVNRNAIVRVMIPVAIRSNTEYQVSVAVAGSSMGSDPLALQLSDIGLGIINMRPLAGGRDCTNHTVQPPFDNDPSLTVSPTARASYPSSLANVGPATVVLSGPRLSKSSNINPRVANNGWVFDVVLALVPAFFAPGTSSVTLTFTITSPEASIPCL